MSLAEFCSGALFSCALVGSGVYAPTVIQSQFTFTSNTMITVMMGASAASAIVLDIEDRLGIMPKKQRSPANLGIFPYDGNIIGGILIGVGMGASGACPGTSLVQAGMGLANGVLVVCGGILGSLAFEKILEISQSRTPADETSDRHPELPESPDTKPLDIATALGIPPLTLLLIWVPMCLAAMGIVFNQDKSVRQAPDSGMVPPAYGGLLIGMAQLATTLLTRHSIGASGAWGDVARWIRAKTAPESSEAKEPRPPLITPSVVFSGGVFCAAAALSHFMRKSGSTATASPSISDPMMAVRAVVGGISMIIGARMANGCTSGHGISGLARFSVASLFSTAALFGGGIVTARILNS